MLLVAVALTVAACSKEESKYPEEMFVGTWTIPFTVSQDVPNVAGKYLVINENHTGIMNTVPFDAWKLEGDELTFTNDRRINGDEVRDLEVLKYTIVNANDSVITLVGRYTHIVNERVVTAGDMSGVYNKKKENDAQ